MPTTSVNARMSDASCGAVKDETSALRRSKICWGSIYMALDGLTHDFLVCRDQLVANRDGELELQLRPLQRDHRVVHFAGLVHHRGDGLVGLALRLLDAVDQLGERVGEVQPPAAAAAG